MTFTPEQIEELSKPLARDKVKTRQQAGRDLAYIEAYHAENEANRIFGFSEWDRKTELTHIADREQDGKWRSYYRARVTITVRTPDGGVVTRDGCGFGSGIDRDLGQAHESALKEAESDAEKRALKTFGNPFGQALYDKDQSQVVDVGNAAADFAIATMSTCRTADEFKDFWAKNKDGLKGQLSPAEYSRVVAAMRETATRFAPAKDHTPFDQKEAA